jgi:hypothetical protein
VNLDRPRVIQPCSAPDPNPLIALPLLSFSLALDSPVAPSRLHPDANRTSLPVHHPIAMAGRTAPAPSPPSPSRPTSSPPLHPRSRHGRYHDQRFGGAGAARCAMRRSPSPPDADHLHPEPVREVSDFHFFDWMACGRASAPPCPLPSCGDSFLEEMSVPPPRSVYLCRPRTHRNHHAPRAPSRPRYAPCTLSNPSSSRPTRTSVMKRVGTT